MSDDNVRELPQNITLDLDAAERKPKDIKPEFAVLIKGRRIVMEDPQNLDWRDLAQMESPLEFLNYALSKEDREFLYEQDLEAWRFNDLMDAYYVHFDLEGQMRDAKRQAKLAGV